MKSIRLVTGLFFGNVTLFGSPLFYLAVLFAMFKANSELFFKATVVMGSVEVAAGLIKLGYGKKRPGFVAYGKGLVGRWHSGSFPSAHSARAAALAVIISALRPEDKTVMAVSVLIALLVGYSRLYLKKHYLADIAGGFAIGILVAGIGLRA